PLRGPIGWTLLALAWGFALAGSIAKIARVDRLGEDSPMPHLAMGWMGLAFSWWLVETVSPGELLWLLGGGLFYSLRLIFFIKDDKPFNHAIWHLFVLAGSICHYRAVIVFI